MRVVAKIQLSAERTGDDIAARALAILERWANGKFATGANGAVSIRQSGMSAQWETTSEVIGDDRLDRMCVLEPVDHGELQLDVDMVSQAKRLAFRCVLRVGSDAGVAPAEVKVRAPRFIREVVALPCSWTVGTKGEGVFAHPFNIDADDLPMLDELLVSPVRRLPLVMVSEHGGETLAGDLHERLAHDLCGIGHVVRLSTDASWALTESRGREWSCYNGAVRLFWPIRAGMGDYRSHPLWTYDQLADRFDTEQDAREHLRASLARRVLEASTFVTDDPAFDDFAVARSRVALEHARAAADEEGDYRELAKAYAVDNVQLRAALDEQRSLVETLRRQLESLPIVDSTDLDSEVEAPPGTVAEAVAIARRELSGNVAIGVETAEDIAQLNAGAGPPDKILRYLRTLGDLASALAQGTIRLSVPQWLKMRNVECSVDSEITKASEKGRRFRTRKVNGETVDCEYHLKPVDKVRPDMCARIYFATATTAPFVKVGYIGRHIE